MVVIDCSNLNVKKLKPYILAQLKKRKYKITPITLNVKMFRKGIRVFTISFKKHSIRTSEHRLIQKLILRAKDHTISIKYYENSFTKPINLKIPSMKYWLEPRSYDMIKKCLNYIDPFDSRVMDVYTRKDGSWLLQGRSGTGKSSLIKIFMVQKKTTHVICFTHTYDIKKCLKDVSEFRVKHLRSKIMVVFEEFDRNLTMDKDVITENITVDSVKGRAKDLLKLYFKNDGDIIDNIRSDYTFDFNTEKKSMEAWVQDIIRNMALNTAKDKTTIDKLTKIISDVDRKISVVDLLKTCEAIHQFSLSMIGNTQVILSTNMKLDIENNKPEFVEKLTTCFRPGRVNVLEFPYLTRDKLQEIIMETYQLKSVEETFIETLMNCGFNKQYNLSILFDVFPPRTTVRPDDITSVCECFSRMTTVDQVFKDDKLKTITAESNESDDGESNGTESEKDNNSDGSESEEDSESDSN